MRALISKRDPQGGLSLAGCLDTCDVEPRKGFSFIKVFIPLFSEGFGYLVFSVPVGSLSDKNFSNLVFLKGNDY